MDTKSSRSSLISSGFYSDHMIAGKYLLAQAIKDNGAVAILQLSHGGRQCNPASNPLPAVAPSAVPCKVVQRMPHALTIPEIEEIEDAFAEAARRAKQASFDGVEIHGAHGYLICSFLSPYTNKRTDAYGGSLENRGRFARNIIRKMREKVGPDYLIGFRISASEGVEGGMNPEDACTFVRSVEKDIDYVNVSAGNYESMATHMIMPLYVPQGTLVPLAAAMKKAVSIPVITVGGLNAELGEKALEEGAADMVAFGRTLIADPELPKKIMEDRLEDIRPCCRGHEGCISLFFAGCPIRCEVNPACGREATYGIDKAAAPRRVVVAGGGMAGLEAARVAALAGHHVTLLEQGDVLGGHFREGTMPDFKREGAAVLKWLVRQVEKGSAEVLLKTEATPETVAELKPDALIVAVGSHYIVPPIEGIAAAMSPDQALLHPETVKERVVVIGGGLIGAETALALAEAGHKVGIVEMLDQIVPEDEPLSQVAIRLRLDKAGVAIHTGHKVVSVAPTQVTSRSADGQTLILPADSIVVATGLAANKEQVERLRGLAPQTFVIGDCVKGRKIFDCFHEAWRAVRSL